VAQFRAAVGEGSAAAAAEDACHRYIEWCRANAAILRVRSLAADEGDERFQQARAEALEPVVALLTDRIAASQARGDLPQDLHARSSAIAFMAMIERLAVAPDYRGPGNLTPGTASLVSAYVLSLLTPGAARPA
jgi:Tetracyclin repressor-like, C-terminal domain